MWESRHLKVLRRTKRSGDCSIDDVEKPRAANRVGVKAAVAIWELPERASSPAMRKQHR